MPYPALLGLVVDTRSHSLRALHPAVTCWVLVALRVQYLDFGRNDGAMVCLWLDCGCLRPLCTGAGLAIRLSRQFDGICGMVLGFLLLTMFALQWKVWCGDSRLCVRGCRYWNFFVRHVPREQFIQGLRCQWIAHSDVVNWGVTEVPCAVTDQGPWTLLDFLCTSGGVSQLVPTSSGYTWISRELPAVHDMLGPRPFWGPVHSHSAGGHLHRDVASQIRCTH